MRKFFEERALNWAYRLLAFVRHETSLRNINADAKLNSAQAAIAEVVTSNYGLRHSKMK